MLHGGLTRVRWLLLLGAGLAVVLALGACGGGGERLSAEDYFKKLEAISNDTSEKESAVQPSEEETANQTPEELKQTAIEFLNSTAAILEEGAKKAEDLNPPDDIQDAHEAAINGFKAEARTFTDFADELQDVAPEDVEDFFNSKVFVESTFAASRQACLALQGVADDRNIDADLRCTEE